MFCRLCFCENNELMVIFDSEHCQNESRIAKIIAKYIHIELQIADPISNKICNDCWQHLEEFDKFFLLIQEKQQTLETKIKCELLEDITIAETTVFQEEIDNVSMHKQPLAELSNEQHYLDDQEFDTPISKKLENHEEADQPTIVSVAVSKKEFKKGRIKTKQSNKLLSKNSHYEDNTRIRNKSAVNSHSGIDVTRENDAFIAENATLCCCICEQTLKNFAGLKKHFLKEHNCKGYIICCNNKFSRRSLYVDHLKLHNNPGLFECKECNKVLASRNSHQNHMLINHSTEESLIYQCSSCTKKFAKQYLLDCHMASHRKLEKNHLCKLCEKSFFSETALKTHQKHMHFSTLQLICDSCGKSFKSKKSLQTHQQNVHQDIKLPEVECKICGKWLKNGDSLRRHTNRHRFESSGKEFVCNKCGAVKSTNQKLKDHMRYHHPDKLQKCTLCEKEFKRTLDLEEHIATHTGEALYACNFCQQTFKSHGNMHKHKRKAHPNEWVRKYSQPSRSIPENSTAEVSNSQM